MTDLLRRLTGNASSPFHAEPTHRHYAVNRGFDLHRGLLASFVPSGSGMFGARRHFRASVRSWCIWLTVFEILALVRAGRLPPSLCFCQQFGFFRAGRRPPESHHCGISGQDQEVSRSRSSTLPMGVSIGTRRRSRRYRQQPRCSSKRLRSGRPREETAVSFQHAIVDRLRCEAIRRDAYHDARGKGQVVLR